MSESGRWRISPAEIIDVVPRLPPEGTTAFAETASSPRPGAAPWPRRLDEKVPVRNERAEPTYMWTHVEAE